MQEVEEALAVENRGLHGCIHGRPGSRRQVLLVDIETLEDLQILPGMVKENLTTRGLTLNGLREGQRLRIGGALLEITGPCHPCHQMDLIRPGLRDELRGRRGLVCRVVETGRIRRGDAIERLNFMQVAS